MFKYRISPKGTAAVLISLFLVSTGHGAVPPLDAWQWRNPRPQGNDLHALIHANGRFVAVGDYGSILHSFDGSKWNVRNLEIGVELVDVAYGSNGVFVAVGEEPAPPGIYLSPRPFVCRSTDGVNWMPLPQPALPRTGVGGVAYGNGVFVMVGGGWYPDFPGTAIFTSTDGANWTDRSLPATNDLFGVTFGSGLFVAVGASRPGVFWMPAILTSPDGVNWTPRDAGSGGVAPGAVAHGNGRFVAVSTFSSGQPPVWTSLDGQTWTHSSILLPVATFIRSLSFCGGAFVLTVRGYAPEVPPTSMFSSADGLNWTNLNIGAAASLLLNTVAHGNGVVASVGEHGNLASSPDGTNWTTHSAATPNNLRGVAHGNGRFVAVGNNGTNLISTDGLTWTGHLAGTTRNLRDVAWVGDTFLAVGSRGTILRSFDGAAWSPAITDSTEDLWDVASGGGTFVAVGGDSYENSEYTRFYRFAILTSTNGLNWSTRVGQPNYLPAADHSVELHGVAYGDGRFVAVGRPRAILSSVNGLTWTTNVSVYTTDPSVPWFYYLKDIAYGNGRFVAVGESTNALVSTNGLNWTEHPLPVPLGTEMDDVSFADGTFLAVGEDGAIISSSNGMDWVRRHSPTDTNLRGVTFGGGSAVIVGNNDLILRAGLGELTFSSTAAIQIPDSGPAQPYPSTITVTGLTSTLGKLVVTLSGLSHTFAGDVNVLLVGPGGQHVPLMVNAGNTSAMTNVTLTFDDDASQALSLTNAVESGTYRPTAYPTSPSDNFPFPAPAPAPLHGTALSVFRGSDPNGTWRLYVFDDESGDTGIIAGGWDVKLHLQDPDAVQSTVIRRITQSGDQVEITWEGFPGWRLQRGGSLPNPQWTDVPGTFGASQAQLPMTATNEFFRLIR